MKKSLISASLLLISTSLIYGNNNDHSSIQNTSDRSIDTSVSTYKTISLTTKSGATLQGNKNGLKIFNNTTSFNVPIFKSNNDLDIYALAEQSDGKIIIGGNFDTVDGYKIKDLVRLNLDGSVDKSFISNYSGFNGAVYALKILQDDSILVGGYFTELGAKKVSKGFVKLTDDGSIDTTYSELNTYMVSIVNDIKTINNKIFLAGTFIKNKNEDNQQAILSIDESGELNKEFSKNVQNIEGEAFKIATQNTSLVLAGDLSVKDNDALLNIIKMDTSGHIDSNFSVPDIQGFIFDAKYKNDTLIIGGELVIKNKSGLTKKTNTALVNTKKGR